jgi:beta-lactamase class A
MTGTVLPRRGLLKAGAAISTTLLVSGVAPAPPAEAGYQEIDQQLRDLEQRYGARLGIYARNTRTLQVVAYRADERFAMCSTFKTFAAAAILRDHRHCAPLDRIVHFPTADLLPNSPITQKHVDTGITVEALCAATIQYSDNTAGNLLLRQLGGPAGLTRFFNSIGDPVSRLDRWENALNDAVPGDPRDTTTPEAMGRSLERVTLGRALSVADRHRLVTWLKGNTTSAARFRAGLPSTWTIGDKTGTGYYATANDVGVAWTTKGTPLVLAVFSSKTTVDAPVDNALIADAARILANTLAPGE